MKKFALALILALCTSVQADDNIVVVLDASGSMKESFKNNPNLVKMDAAKDVLIKVLKSVPDETNVGLVVFSAWNLSDEWVYPLAKLDKNTLEDKIRNITPSGGTPLGKYLKIGADVLLKEREKEHGYGTYKLLMVTDGEATDGAYVNAYLPEILARGITVDVIGVDMSKSIALATMVNSYRSADSKEALEKAVSVVLGEIKVNKDNHIQDEVFEYMNSFQDQESVKKVIETLTDMPNHPIGEKPQVQSSSTKTASSTSIASATPSTGMSASMMVLCFVGGIIGIAVILVVAIAVVNS